MKAFKKSIENNIRYLECDIHLTKDDEVIIAHDYNLSRTCLLNPNEDKEYIGEFNYNELPPYRKKYTTGLIGELTFEDSNEEDTQICKLEELFIFMNLQEN